MAKPHLLAHGTRETPQSEPMREDQVPNSAGGYSWQIDKWAVLNRFLILGTEGGSYYANERKLTQKNILSVRACIKEDGVRAVNTIVEVSEAGRAPKNDQALYALAACISLGDKETKRAAAEALPRVARIGTHLFSFIAYAQTMRGWGRTMRWAVGNWYDRNPDQLAYQAIKYRQRDGWSKQDPMRKAHPLTSAENRDTFGFLSGNVEHDQQVIDGKVSRLVKPWVASENTHPLIQGFLAAQESDSPARTAALVREYGLPREALKTEHLSSIEVWQAMLEKSMPMTALIRNLAVMTRNGTLDDSEALKLVLGQLGNEEQIRKSRVHPLAILVAQRTYASGQGHRSRGEGWTPKPKITDALDAAFYTAFGNVEPTGKNTLLALDISSSMTWGSLAGSPLTPRDASAAMALVTMAVEDNVEVVGFSTHLISLGISSRQRLDDAIRTVSDLPFGGTDCALPMLYATQQNKTFETFVVYTDSETWAGRVHPKQALDHYRQKSGLNARSIVCGMVANDFTIADPTDAGMLDVVGFDTATPGLIADFSAGKI